RSTRSSCDTDEKYQDVRIIFTDTETSNWTWDPVANQYYWHRFFHHQPDLNYDHPAVQEEIFKILDYWMEMGIDGFRLDAIPYLFEREGTNGENLPETHTFLKKLRKHVDEKYDNVLFLAEANMWPEDSASYFGDGDECHMNYHFPLMPRLYMSVKMEDRHPITDIFDQTPEIPENCQWATFLRNHDELTLEMVTDEERDFMYKVYASDKTARINLGIRRRLAPLMENDRNKIELLNVLLLSLPGTPVLYYGDEIGMGDNYYLGDRDGVRTPMQWNNNENAGFSDANPHSLYLPVIRDTEYSYRWVNVRRQEQTPNSLLNWTRRILAKRKEFSVFGRGSIKWLQPENGRILAFVREYEEEKILVVVNLSRHSQSVQLDLSEYIGKKLREVFGRTYFNDIGREPYQITIAGHGYFWLQIETAGTYRKDQRDLSRPQPLVLDLENFFTKSVIKALEKNILPRYLASVGWMGAKANDLERIKILHHRMHFNERRHFGYILCRVVYHEDLPEMIQLPLALHNYREEINYAETEAAICRLQYGNEGKEGVLIDALYDEEYRMGLFNEFEEFGLPGNFYFTPNENYDTALGVDVVALDHSGPEYHLIQSRNLTVKYYRRVDSTMIPDLEIKKMLNRHNYPAAPTVAGLLEFKPDNGWSTTVASIESREHTDGLVWDFVHNQFQRFAEEVLTKRRRTNGNSGTPSPSAEEEVAVLDAMVYKDMPDLVQEILGSAFVTRMADLGRSTAAYHALLAEVDEVGYRPEALSLHYQRSLYAGHKGQIRATITLLRKKLTDLEEEDQQLALQLLNEEERIHELLKKVFRHKIESDKIRIHGDYTLEQVHLRDETFLIRNFDGDPDQAYSQRKLRRSPAKDIANMLRSFNYAAGLALKEQGSISEDALAYLREWLKTAYRCLAAEYLTAYRKATTGSRLLPQNEDDLKVLLDTFMIEKALQEIRYDLNYRLDQAGIAIRGLLDIILE
ncbi:MAG: alpha-amylase family glycosyl hydrolase, partial [Bacteroidota bacterium]